VPMTPEPQSRTVTGMTFPVVIEKPAHLEPVARDTFADDTTDITAAERAATWPWPSRRPADA
jgi:hypothetical protein